VSISVRLMGRRYEPQLALGLAVRQAREQAGLTQSQLAEQANMNKTWISHIESGRVNPAYGTLRRISQALGIALSSLIASAETIESRGP
jgi:transcriptional regulator with XRE-family HTH domain